jgi:RNA polymerase sigma-70 factor (ECF subfamily)
MPTAYVRHSPLDAADTALVDAARAGDRHALGSLLRRHEGKIRRICHRLGRDLPDIEDLHQDTLLGITRNIAQYRGDAAFSTWVFTIARSCANRMRKRPGRTAVPTAFVGSRAADDRSDLDDLIGGSEVRRAIAAAVDGLAELDRSVLMMRDLEGRSADEVARALGLTVSAVKSRLHRARCAVRAALAPFVEARPDLGILAAGPGSRVPGRTRTSDALGTAGAAPESASRPVCTAVSAASAAA